MSDLWPIVYNESFWSWSDDILKNSNRFWLLAAAVGVFRWKKLNDQQRRILSFVTYTWLMEYATTNTYLNDRYFNGSNSILYHVFTPGLFWTMSRVWYPALFTGKWRFVRWALPLAFLILVATLALFNQNYSRFPSVAVATYSLTGMGLAVAWFLLQLQTLAKPRLEREPLFWFSAGSLVYLSGALLIWASLSLLTFNREFFNSIYSITLSLNTVFIVINIGALCLNEPTKTTPATTELPPC